MAVIIGYIIALTAACWLWITTGVPVTMLIGLPAMLWGWGYLMWKGEKI